MIIETVTKKIMEKFQNPNDLLVVGICGMPGAGKSFFSKELASCLTESGVNAIPWLGDMYTTTSRAQRSEVMKKVKELKAQGKKFDRWYNYAYGFNTDLLADHLKLIRGQTDFSSYHLCNPATKELNLNIHVSFKEVGVSIDYDGNKQGYGNAKTVFVVDYAFVNHPQIRENLDFMIYLDSDYETRIGRVRDRCSKLQTPVTVDEDLFKDVDDHQKEKYHISPENADIVIDNNDFSNQKILRAN